MKTKLLLIGIFTLIGCDNSAVRPDTPTNLEAFERNDFNAVQLKWNSDPTRSVTSWVEETWTLNDGSSGKVTRKLNSGNIFWSYLDAKTLADLRFRVEDCFEYDSAICSDFTEQISVPIDTLKIKAATNVTVTEIRSKKGSAYRAVNVSWTNNDYEETTNAINVAGMNDDLDHCFVCDLQMEIVSSSQMDVDGLPPDTNIWIFVVTYYNGIYGKKDPGWSTPTEFTTSP